MSECPSRLAYSTPGASNLRCDVCDTTVPYIHTGWHVGMWDLFTLTRAHRKP